MATRKRASTRSKLLKRAVKAGRSALREAERRMPPDVRKQLERTIKDGQKTIHSAIKDVRTRLDRTARQADLDKAMKRLDALSKQVRNLATRPAESTTAPTRRKPAARKPAARRAAARKPAARRKPSARRATSTSAPAAPATMPAPEPTPETGPF